MSKINILDKGTINQIAAGEVIDRPASVIKELVENSLDAGAASVSVEIKGGGIEMIRITDNGSGIDREDIRKAFIRHTTSKIRTAQDLSYITSLGFRGEALASIAAVADVELITKTKEDFSAVRYCIGGGEEQSFEEIGAPDGTTFIIRDVFKYVPVRKKFLKSSATEGAYCNEVVERIAVSHPDVSIKYVNNGRNIIFTNGSGKMKDVILGVYGRDVAGEIIELDYDGPKNIHVSGCICRPTVVRSNRNTENYFVNGRYIKSQILYKAIEDAYQPFLMQHKYPFCDIYLDIDPAFMDVNVHPSKQEVRFENPEAVYEAVYSAITDTLSGKALIHRAEKAEKVKGMTASPDGPGDNAKKYIPEPFEVNLKNSCFSKAGDPPESGYAKVGEEEGKYGDIVKEPVCAEVPKQEDTVRSGVSDIKNVNTKEVRQDTLPSEEGDKKPFIAEVFRQDFVPEYKQSNIFEQDIHIETRSEFRKAFTDYRIVGQIFGTYWIIESDKCVYIIDQHAAHEKILYERFMKDVGKEQVPTQLLSPPVIVSLSSREEEAFARYRNEIEEQGFTAEHFGGHEYAVSQIPMNLYGLDARDMFLEILDELAKDVKGNVIRSIKERLATCACKAAVTGNTNLSVEEAKELIKQLLKAENPFNCPHGRPVIIDVTKSEIEKKFKRIV